MNEEKNKCNIYALTCGIINIGMGLFHIALIMGAPLGEFVYGGYYTVLPEEMHLTSIIVIIIFWIMALIYLQAGGYINFRIKNGIVIVIISISTILYLFTIFSNIMFSESIKEKALMVPLSSIQFCSSLLTFISLLKISRNNKNKL